MRALPPRHPVPPPPQSPSAVPGWLPPPDPLTAAAAESYVHGICFKTGPPRRVGVELEWIVQDSSDPALPVEPSRLTGALASLPDPGRLPEGALITREPGGQVELSSLPADSLHDCVTAVRRDLGTLRGALCPHGLTLAGWGHEPWRHAARVLDLPRYAAMEEYFDRHGPEARGMMTATASVQVCVDAGTEEPGPEGFARRWRLAHLLGPVLLGAFANSPLRLGRPSGWRSTRQALWARMDPGRTRAPALDEGTDPRAAWAAYALDAAVMCVREDGDGPWAVPGGVSFRRWIAEGERACDGVRRAPTLDDLAYHLTTLFPPVRPRGHLELRMIDAQPGPDGWIVPLAVVTALFGDRAAADTAEDAVRDLAPPGVPAPRNPVWLRAARHGLADPALRRAALTCFTAAARALPRTGADDAVTAAVTDFTERYVARGRCPADDLLDAVRGASPRPLPRAGRSRARTPKENRTC
ncbi:ergothioneine biosynthesis glutamate--cysteine ligase EgtA [Streptomyces capparidis]